MLSSFFKIRAFIVHRENKLAVLKPGILNWKLYSNRYFNSCLIAEFLRPRNRSKQSHRNMFRIIFIKVFIHIQLYVLFLIFFRNSIIRYQQLWVEIKIIYIIEIFQIYTFFDFYTRSPIIVLCSTVILLGFVPL